MLYVKGFPEELHRKLRLEAYMRGMTLKAVVIEKLARVTTIPAKDSGVDPAPIDPEPSHKLPGPSGEQGWTRKPLFKGKEGKLI